MNGADARRAGPALNHLCLKNDLEILLLPISWQLTQHFAHATLVHQKFPSGHSSATTDASRHNYPETARGHQAVGQNYDALKMYPDAVKQYQLALSQRPDLPGLRLELGQVYVANSEWEKAEEQFRGETKLQPGNSEAAYRLGDAMLQQGKMKEAAAELRRSDALRPDMPETLYSLGRAEAVSDPKAAEQALARVIALERETLLAGQANLALAGIHRKQGKTKQAAEEMQEFHRIEALSKSHAPTTP